MKIEQEEEVKKRGRVRGMERREKKGKGKIKRRINRRG